MKKGKGPAPRRSGRPQPARGKPSAGARKNQPPKRPSAKPKQQPQAPIAPEPRVFRLAVVPGVMPGKWLDIWQDRYPHVTVELAQVAAHDARALVLDGSVDAALLRSPLDPAGLSAIRLYDETPVVVVSTDSALTAAEELTVSDLADEVLITSAEDTLHIGQLEGTVAPRFSAPATTKDAVELVASGVGIIIVPMSLARLHHRKDVEYRPLANGPLSTVSLAWSEHNTTEDIDAFIGVVRGRTANSSR